MGPIDWKSVIQMAGPVLGAFQSNPAGHAAFQRGWQDAQDRHRQQTMQDQQIEQRKQQANADFLMKIGEHASTFDDPVALNNFLGLADDARKAAGLTGEPLRGRFTVPESKIVAKRTKQIKSALDSLGGYDLDQLAQSGAHVRLEDGTDLPISTALDMVNARPKDAAGMPVPKPKKQDVAAPTDFGRFLSRRAKALGKSSVEDLTDAEELQAKKDYGQADARPAGMGDTAGPAAQFNDLVDIWKQSHPGQEPTAAIRTQLRSQANRVNDRPQAFSGMNALYAATDPASIAQGIREGTSPPDISQYGRAVQGAIASELRKPGPNGEKPFDLSSAQRQWNAQKNLNRTMNGSQQVRLDESIRSGLAMYDKIDAIASQWDGLGLGPLSRASLALARQGAKGQKAQSLANQLTSQIGQLTSDVATIEQGGLTPTNESRAIAERSLQDWWSRGTIHDLTAQGRYNMQIRHLARNTQEPMTPGNGLDTSPALPATPAPTKGASIKVGGFTVVVK